MSIQKEWLDFLREQFVEAKSAPRETPCGHSTLRSLASPLPTETAARVSTGAPFGSRIKVRTLGEGAPDALKPGATGSLEHIDGNGVFHVAWDSGETLPLVIGQDSFSVSPPPLQTLKLYMPMTATYYDEDDPEQDITMDSREAAEYAPQIINALQSERRWLENEGPEEAERGLMAYFDGPDSVDQKVQSCFFTAEVRDGQLWGVAECKVRGSLTPLELKCLTDEIGGQASDGVGESFEQREIRAGDGLEIYAHLWQSKGWTIMPEQDRFDPHFSDRLPDMCFTVLPEDGALAYIINTNMKNHKRQKEFTLPGEVVDICGFDPGEALSCRVEKDLLVAAPASMTALQTVRAIDALTCLAAEFLGKLKDACGPCEGVIASDKM